MTQLLEINVRLSENQKKGNDCSKAYEELSSWERYSICPSDGKEEIGEKSGIEEGDGY